jgi:hypothetical protein
MHNYSRLIALLKSTCGHSHILTIPRPFLDFTGSFEAALLLSQIIYWSDRGRDPDGWFYKSYAQWQDEIGLSEYHVRKSSNKLVKLGLLETKVKRAATGSPTLHYRLDWPNFSGTFLNFLQEGTLKKFRNEPERISETLNTKTTTETTNKKEGAAHAATAPIAKVQEKSQAGSKPSPAPKIFSTVAWVNPSALNLLGRKRRFYSLPPLTRTGFLVGSWSQTCFTAKHRERSPPSSASKAVLAAATCLLASPGETLLGLLDVPVVRGGSWATFSGKDSELGIERIFCLMDPFPYSSFIPCSARPSSFIIPIPNLPLPRIDLVQQD